MDFQGFPGTPQIERMTPVEANALVQLGSKLTAYQLATFLPVRYKPVSCKLTGSERITRL